MGGGSFIPLLCSGTYEDLFVFSMCFFWGGESGSYTLGTTVSLPVSSPLDPELARSDGLICEYERGER